MVESGYNSFESSFYNDPKRHLLMSLEDEMWAAGLNPYDQNVYGRSDELIQKVPSIKKLATQ